MTAPRSLLDIVRRAATDIEEVGGSLALVGGLAVGVHADFVVAVSSDAQLARWRSSS